MSSEPRAHQSLAAKRRAKQAAWRCACGCADNTPHGAASNTGKAAHNGRLNRWVAGAPTWRAAPSHAEDPAEA